jgi:peptidoglycan/LPS O-acetylase OafA/YrhL
MNSPSIPKTNNFDFLRHFLAFSVVWHHFIVLTGISYSFFVFDLINSNIAVKAFFVISGLLIWISANNTNTITAYTLKRLFRLYPALIFILFTSSVLTLVVYEQPFTEILQYFSWNSIFLNFMHPCIGNVFDSNELCAVNGALWTLKLEVSYYFFIGITVFFMKTYAYKLVVIFTIISVLIETCLLFIPYLNESYALLLSNQIPFKFYYFGLGVIINNYHKSISTLNFLLAFFLGLVGWFGFNIEFFFLPLFVVSFVFLIAFRTPIINMSRFGDLSYGLYIFHFPLIQLFVYNDWLSGRFYIDFFIIISILLILSRISWLHIESKSISYGKQLITKTKRFSYS